MTLRRNVPLALALVVLAVGCKKVNQESPASTLVFATFDSTKGVIPTPNDLALQATPKLPTSAQKELLQAFVTGGGFPADQEVAISVPFRAVTFDAATNLYKAAAPPVVDPKSVTPGNVAVYRISGTGAPERIIVTAETDPLDSSVLKIRKAADATGSRRWTPNARYVVAVRGGEHGVRTTTGLPVNADQAISLVAQNKDMTLPENQPPGGLPPATAASLDGLRKLLWNAVPWCDMTGLGWNPVTSTAAGALCVTAPLTPAASAFGAVSSVIPAADVAAIATFQVGTPPAGPYVIVDSGSGVAPLPFDLLREAVPADTTQPLDGGLVKPNPAFGAAGAGLVTLDGFSTTAMILAQTSEPILASTVAPNVKLYTTSDGTTWSEVTALVKQPPTLVSSGASVAIGLQPAVWASAFALPPLAENTKYAVVATNGVTGASTTPMVRSTFAKLLLEMTEPVVSPWPVAQGTNPATLKSLLAGMDAQTAAGIQKMRAEIDSLVADRALTKADITAAWTFKTQKVTGTSVKVTAAPYGFETSTNAALFTPGPVTAIPEDTVCASIGQAAGCFPTVFPNVADFYTTAIDTPNGVDYPSGFLAVPQSLWTATGVKNTLGVLVAAPKTSAVGATHLAPLVVFHHGITRSRMDMAAIANALAGQGFVVVAIDAPYHGSRSFCKQDSDCGASGTCSPIVNGGSLSSVPGTCTAGTLDPTVASGNYFVSGNFFRTRDAIRQDLMDQSALVLAVARPPSSPAGSTTLSSVLGGIGGPGLGYAVDPTKVYFVGQSLGGIIGAEMLATNPRYGRGVVNVAGGTLTDVFTQAPDFKAQTDALFLSMGIDRSKIATDPAVAAAYLKTVNVAKWILDPADPVNYAAYIVPGLTSPLDALAAGLGVSRNGPQGGVFGMAAFRDTTVPNPFNWELYGLAGTSHFTQATYFAAGSTNSAPVTVPHGFLLSPTGSSLAALGRAQSDAAGFLSTLALPANDLTVTGVPGTQVLLP